MDGRQEAMDDREDGWIAFLGPSTERPSPLIFLRPASKWRVRVNHPLTSSPIYPARHLLDMQRGAVCKPLLPSGELPPSLTWSTSLRER